MCWCYRSRLVTFYSMWTLSYYSIDGEGRKLYFMGLISLCKPALANTINFDVPPLSCAKSHFDFVLSETILNLTIYMKEY